MTTNVAPAPLSEIVDGLVEAAVAAVSEAVGASLDVSAPIAVDAVDAADAVGFRSEISGPAGAGGLIVTIPASGIPSGDDVVEPLVAAGALFEGAAAGMTAAKGTPHRSSPPEPVDSFEGSLAVRFEIGTEAGRTVPIHWVVEASLGSIVAEGVPVTPSPAADPSVAPAAFPELGGGSAPGAAQDLALLSDVPMSVTVELGRAVMPVRELLTLKEGSIVELDRDAGAAVDVLVNGTLVARGDVVVIDDELGVRITEIIER